MRGLAANQAVLLTQLVDLSVMHGDSVALHHTTRVVNVSSPASLSLSSFIVAGRTPTDR